MSENHYQFTREIHSQHTSDMQESPSQPLRPSSAMRRGGRDPITQWLLLLLLLLVACKGNGKGIGEKET